jgi:hypothetical protein
MQAMSRRAFVGSLAAVPLAAAADEGWAELFDGRSLNGWKPSENKDSWRVVDGMLTANGPRSHLFYTGAVNNADFRNFELEVELITQPECNSGVYFHTAYQESGFPEKGFEIQVNNTAHGDGGYLERKKTGSLYGLRNMYMQLVPDLKPFRYNIAVRGKNVQIRLNGQLLVDYVEPTRAVVPTGGEKGRFLDHGTFALQCHNNGSRAAFRSVRVRPLPDGLPAYTSAAPAPVADETFRQIINIGRHNIPMVDYHAFLRDGMTLDELLAKSRRDGLQYGVTALSSQFRNEEAAEKWVSGYAGRPVFRALQAEGPVSHKTALLFDYVIADARKWMPMEGVPVDDLRQQLIHRLDTEPVDLLSHVGKSDELWNEALIEALVRNKVAVEINTVNELPGKAFIERARDAGCKFGFGSGNESAGELKRCEYGLRMVEECKLDWKNFYAPGGWYPKAAVRRG